MNELLVVFFILVTIAVAYLWVYPRFAGDNVRRMAYLDIAITGVPVGLAALLFWQSDPSFRFIFFDTNWFFFTVLAMVVIEAPIFYLYLKARGLSYRWSEILGIAGKQSGDSWASASAKSVEKQLNDTKWDGLRTRGAKRFLLLGSNIAILFGTGFLMAVGDSDWTLYSLIHILLIAVFWFLLRQSVRLIADAPDEALDERMVGLRDRAYLIAYRWLSALAFVGVTALMVFAIISDAQPDSDGFNYLLEFTWPQVQAVFWVFAGYAFMLPSMALLSVELRSAEKGANR